MTYRPHRILQGDPLTTGDLLVATNGLGEVFVTVDDGIGKHGVRISRHVSGDLQVIPWPNISAITIKEGAMRI